MTSCVATTAAVAAARETWQVVSGVRGVAALGEDNCQTG